MLLKRVLASLAIVLILSGCTKAGKPAKTNPKLTPKREIKNKVNIYMMGRSVMGGWFSHWGSVNNKYKKDEFILYYKELATPPDIANSASSYIDELKNDDVVFFKFCFDDFSAGSPEEAIQSLKEKKQYAEEVYQAADAKDLPLIIGNALPRVAKYTEPELVKLHRNFNRWLEEFVQNHQEEVLVFDMYGILTDEEGNLKSNYSNDGEDSHPNEAAYQALDQEFFGFLEENF